MSVEIIHTAARSSHRLVIQDANGDVWLTFQRPAWDLASWLWWWLLPGKKAWLQVRRGDGQRIRVRAARVGRDLIRIGGRPQ